MAQVVFLKGVNVGGYRTFRPSLLAKAMARLDVVNIGAAGTFVVRKPVTQSVLRAQLLRRLPFEAEVMIVEGNAICRLARSHPFAGQRSSPHIVQFVSVLARRRPLGSDLPLNIPAKGEWGVRILACSDRFVVGLHRRNMRAIGYLGQLEKLFGVPVTTRSWSTIVAIARILDAA